LPLAAGVSAVAAGTAWVAGTLTRTGAAAAWTVGFLILFGTGWEGGAVLAAFFVSSSLVSRFARTFPGVDPKGNCRDHRQVFANGGVAALCAVLGFRDPSLALWLVTASLAAAGADTWATSLGSWSRVPPRLLWSDRRVAPGTSGGITLLGCMGAVAGAALVAAIGALVGRLPVLFPVGTLIGFVGMVADSALGGGVQGRFYCPACEQSSEWRTHRCGAPTVWRGGVRWLDNDLVNLLTTALAAVIAALLWARLAPSLS
jgi:uncharacterized protein (TIGR00297 family)